MAWKISAISANEFYLYTKNVLGKEYTVFISLESFLAERTSCISDRLIAKKIICEGCGKCFAKPNGFCQRLISMGLLS